MQPKHTIKTLKFLCFVVNCWYIARDTNTQDIRYKEITIFENTVHLISSKRSPGQGTAHAEPGIHSIWAGLSYESLLGITVG